MSRWPRKWLAGAASAKRDLWRGVEAQHRVATMRLVDTLREQDLLEQLLEQSKPPLPPQAR
ncbi:MAG TPA: RES domain-containing protein, partial [Ramlibacter sp.]